jgi:hypothetical protein
VRWGVLPGEVLKPRNYRCNGNNIVAENGKVYLAPCLASRALCLDIENETASFIGGEITGKDAGGDKYAGTVKGKDGKLYGIPARATRVMCIDPETEDEEKTVTFFGDLESGDDKWLGGVCVDDGRIFGIPGYGKVLCIDPVNRTATTIGTAYEDTEHAWFGGVLAQNGKVYAFPFNGSQMSCINPKTNCTSLIANRAWAWACS